MPPSIRPAPENMLPLKAALAPASASAAAGAGTGGGESLIILSDVHLGSDLDDLSPPEERAHRTELVDDDLARLIRHYRDTTPDGQRWRLVIAGDFIDFIGMTVRADGPLTTAENEDEKEYGLGNAEEHVRMKLRRVATRHDPVFRALAEFVAAGNALTFIHGNHDVELHWPGVQEELRAQLCARAPDSAPDSATGVTDVKALFEGSVAFHPWFFHVDGVVWIEHGHHYDPYCATENLMAPVSALDPLRMARGFTDVLLRRVVRRTRGLNEHGHEHMGVVDYLAIGARLGFRGMFALVARFAGAVAELLRVRRQHFAEAGRALREEHDRRVGLLAEATRIGVDRLRSLAALQAPPITRSIHGILASVLLDRIALGLFGSIALVIAAFVAVRHGSAAWVFPASVVLAWAVTHRQLTRLRKIDPVDVLIERAGHLAKMFPVAFVVMGHTHVPMEVSVAQQTTYINLGAWAEEEGDPALAHIPQHRAPRTHLVIRIGASGPVADLMAWDSATSAPRRFIA